MLKLLRSDLSRLFRLRSLYIFLVVAFFFDYEQIMSVAKDFSVTPPVRTDFDICENLTYLCLGLIVEGAVIIGNLIGSDYTFSTIRNKAIAGYTRIEIFFSNWFASFICMLILTAESYAVILITGMCMGGTYSADAQATAIFAGLTLMFVLVCSALFTAVYMAVFSQSAAMTATLISVGVVIIATLIAVSQINEPEYIDEKTAMEMSSSNIIIKQDPEDPTRYLNPNYAYEGSKTEHTIDILSPMSHLLSLREDRLPENFLAMSSEIILFTAGGFLLFRKRDIR